MSHNGTIFTRLIRDEYRWVITTDIPRLVSIVLPVFNQAEYLELAIESILKQIYQRWELIIVDDGSTDDIESVLVKYQYNQQIYIYRRPHYGLPAALTFGFQHARGEYRTWTSADNILHYNNLFNHVDFLRNNPEVHMVYSNFEAMDDKGFPIRKYRLISRNNKLTNVVELPLSTDTLNTSYNFIGPSFMYRSIIGRIIGSYSGELGMEDYDYWMRLNTLFTIKHLGREFPYYKYRYHGNSLTGQVKNKDLFKERLNRLFRHDNWRRLINTWSYSWIMINGDGQLCSLKTKFNYAKQLILPRIRYQQKQIVIVNNPQSFSSDELLGWLEVVRRFPHLIIFFLMPDEMNEPDFNNPILKQADWILTGRQTNFDRLWRKLDKVLMFKKWSKMGSILEAMTDAEIYNKHPIGE